MDIGHYVETNEWFEIILCFSTEASFGLSCDGIQVSSKAKMFSSGTFTFF